MVSLLHPSLLPWLLAVSVPVIIHLLTRKTRRRVELPTVKFLQRSMAHQSSIFRWRHWLLMALRMLAIVALVIAFTRPTLNSPLAPPANARACAVVILDTSASMGYSGVGITTFARARDAADKLITGLGPGVQANVVFAGAHPEAALSAPTSDMVSLQQAITRARATEERSDPNGAINLALEQIGKTQATSKRIYIVSDFQRSNWADVKFEPVPADASIVFVSAVSGDRSNLGITGLRLAPATPQVGEPLTVDCEVFNSSSRPQSVPVTLTVSTGVKQTQTVTVEPYSSAEAGFSLQFDTPQRIECTASLPADSMPADDTRRIIIDLKHTPQVLLITDENSSKPIGASYFLARALHPVAAAASGFSVTPVKPESLRSATLKTADAVIVCNASSIPAIQYQALSDYASGGGNLVWFLCGDGIADQINSLGRVMPATEPIPLQIDHVSDLNGNGRGYVTLAEAHYESPLLKAFKDPAAANLSLIHFRKICVTGEVDPRAETLLKFDDGTSAAVHSVMGSGNLLLVNMSPDPTWSDLARQPAFLPLMHEFLKGLLSKNSTAPQFVAGGSAAASIPPDASTQAGRVSCAGPTGDVPVTTDTATGSIVIDRAPATGFYHILKGSSPITTLAVNTDGDETDLRTIDPRELESQQKRQSSYFAAMGQGGSDLDSLGKEKPIWQYLLALALLCLFGEQWLARLKPRARRT